MADRLRTIDILSKLSHATLNILFPPLCMHCHAYIDDPHRPLCPRCHDNLERNTALQCPICDIRLANNRRICHHGAHADKRFPYLLGAACNYDDPIIRSCIHACKYQGSHAATSFFAQLLADHIRALQPAPSILSMSPTVIPIPLHPSKERKRGFNQSALIAKAFARTMELPYDEPLIKTVNSMPQAQTKTHTERFEHMIGAFSVPHPHTVQNKNIILIDDVSTSGATLSEATRSLKAAGAKQILALVVARA